MEFLIGIIWLLNAAISFWNCRVVGLMWNATKEMGGVARFMTWMGAIMGASGFSWCILIFLVLGGGYFYPQYLTPDRVQASLSLGYLMIIPGVLFSGFAIWIQSLVEAYRRRDMASVGIAGWNTAANAYNTYSAVRNVPVAWKDVSGLFKDSKNGAALVVVLVVVALAAGIILAASIINHYSKKELAHA